MYAVLNRQTGELLRLLYNVDSYTEPVETTKLVNDQLVEVPVSLAHRYAIEWRGEQDVTLTLRTTVRRRQLEDTWQPEPVSLYLIEYDERDIEPEAPHIIEYDANVAYFGETFPEQLRRVLAFLPDMVTSFVWYPAEQLVEYQRSGGTIHLPT
jgi:hypothetical protein